MGILGQQFLQKVYYRTLSENQLLIFICSRVIVLCGLLLIRKSKIGDRIRLSDYKNVVILMSLISCVILERYQCIMQDMAFARQDIRGEDMALSLFFIILLIMCGTIFMYKYQTIQKEKEYLVSRDKMSEQYYCDLMEMVEKNRQLIHDVKNHFVALRGYDEEGNIEGIHRYLTEISEEFLGENDGIKTGIHIVDMILNQKKNEAEKYGIICDFQVMPGLSISLKDSELCAVFGNLLDNAIEACERMKVRKRWIFVTIEKRGGMFFWRFPIV